MEGERDWKQGNQFGGYCNHPDEIGGRHTLRKMGKEREGLHLERTGFGGTGAWCCDPLYSFAMAAVTNCLKLGS